MKKRSNSGKPTTSSVVILCIFFIAFCGMYFYKIRNYNQKEKVVYSYEVNDNNQYYSQNLVSNTFLEQQISLPSGNYNGLFLKFKDSQKNDNGAIVVRVYHNQELLAEQRIETENLNSNTRISFFDTLNLEQEDLINLEIESDVVQSTDSIEIGLVEKTNSTDVFYQNGLEQSDLINVKLIKLEKDTSIETIYIIATIFTFAFIMGCLKFSNQFTRLGYHGVFLRLFPIICLAYLTIFTPETIPDEALHFDSAYQYSNIMMFKANQRSEKRTCDLTYTDTDSIINKQSYYKVSENHELFCSNAQMQPVSDNLVTNAPIAYVPAAIGIVIARIFHLGPLYLYNLGRIFNMLACYGLMYFAIKKIPFGKSMLFTLCFLPMVTHLVCSYSYDGMILSLAFILSAYILDMIYSNKQITKQDIAIVTILSILLAPCKIVYASICCLTILIPKKNMEEYKFKYWPHVLCILGAVIAIVGVQLTNISNVGLQTNIIEWAQAPGYTLSWALANPASAIHVFVKTVKKYGSSYLTRMIGSSLGWLRIEIPWYVILGFIVVIFISLVKDEEDKIQIKNLDKIVALVLCSGSILLIMYSMFTGHTPQGWDVIEGVQGRYFIPLLPMFYLVVRNNFIVTDLRRDQLLIKLIGLFQTLTILTGFIAILNY